jgi:hypothetical protein
LHFPYEDPRSHIYASGVAPQKRRMSTRKQPRPIFSEGGPALTQVTADLIRANLDEIVTAMDDQRNEASGGPSEELLR